MVAATAVKTGKTLLTKQTLTLQSMLDRERLRAADPARRAAHEGDKYTREVRRA
jgi:hypothetical protein